MTIPRDEFASVIDGLSPTARDFFHLAFTSTLIHRPFDWRERRVDTITALDDKHYRQRMGLQFSVGESLTAAALERAIQFITLTSSAPASTVRDLREFARTNRPHILTGQSFRAVVPLVSLPKNVLMKVDLEGQSGRLPMLNRYQDSAYSAFHLRFYFEAAVLSAAKSLGMTSADAVAVDLAIPHAIIHALTFHMPGLVDATPRRDRGAFPSSMR